MVCDNLIDYCEHLLNVNNVKHVVILQIVHRLPPLYKICYEVDTTWFNNRADETNILLRQAAPHNNKLTFFTHRRLCEHSVLTQAMTWDGVHLNVDYGYPKYVRNIRAAVMAVYNKLRRQEYNI